MESKPRRTLSKAQRITQSRDFARLKEAGRRTASGCLVVNWKILPPGSGSRLGVVTSKSVGHAVARNRARRLLREAFRMNRDCLSAPAEMVLIARPSIAGLGLSAVIRDLVSAWRKAGLVASGPLPA